jgi:pyruvate, water dikinase
VEGRRLRLDFIAQVLGPLGFVLDFRGDMLDARAARRDEGETQKLLALLGGLLAETRLMDLRLSDPAQVAALARDFLARRRGGGGEEL